MKPHATDSLQKPDIPDAPSTGDDAGRTAGGARSSARSSGSGSTQSVNPSDCLALDLGDFASRIPRCYLKVTEIDLQRPLLFDLDEVADRISRGITTIPLTALMERAPEIFVDLAQVERSLEIRFPWQKVMALMNDSKVAPPETGQATLAQRLRQRRGIVEQLEPPVVDAIATRATPPRPSQIKGRARADRANVWFSPTKAAGIGQVGSRAPQGSAGALDLTARDQAPPAAVPPWSAEPAARSAQEVRAPFDMPDLLFDESAPAEPLATDGDPRKLKAKIGELEARLAALSRERRTEAAALRAESGRLVEEARAEAKRMEAHLAAEFASELERLMGEMKEPAASGQADRRVASSGAALVAERERLRAERQGAERIAAEVEAALAGKEAEIATLKTEYESAISASEEAWEKAIAMIAEEDEAFAKEKQALAEDFERRLAKVIQNQEAVAAERDRFAAFLAEREQQAGILTAQLQAELAAERAERDDLLTERNLTATLHADLEATLRKAKAEAESKLLAATLERDAARAELREVEMLLTAQSIFHEERSASPLDVETFLESLRQRRLEPSAQPGALMTAAA